MSERRISAVDLLRIKLSQEIVTSSALRLKLAEAEAKAIAVELGLSEGDRISDDGTVLTPKAP